MSKKGASRDGSKKQAVRDYLANNKDASLKTIQADLKSAGVEVSAGTINKVKYESPKKAGKARASAGGVNISQEIRKIMTENTDATRPDIKRELKARGLKAAPALVNNVYVTTRKKMGLPIIRVTRGIAEAKPARKAAGRPAAKAVAAPQAVSSGLTVESLVEAKQLVDQLGGIASVRRALDMLERLQ